MLEYYRYTSLMTIPVSPTPVPSFLGHRCCRNPSLFISAALLSLMVMLRLELPHINVLSKVTEFFCFFCSCVCVNCTLSLSDCCKETAATAFSYCTFRSSCVHFGSTGHGVPTAVVRVCVTTSLKLQKKNEEETQKKSSSQHLCDHGATYRRFSEKPYHMYIQHWFIGNNNNSNTNAEGNHEKWS